MTKINFVSQLISTLLVGGLIGCGEVDDRPPASSSEETLVDERDGQIYRVVTISSQVWVAENLNYDEDGSSCYNDLPDNCAKYGRLYTFDAAKKACPGGWHLPSEDEWDLLRYNLGDADAGKKLKSEDGWELYNGTDEYGFTALPAGYHDGSAYDLEGKYAYFWSSTEGECPDGYIMGMTMGYKKGSAYLDCVDNRRSLSVRCIKD